MKGQEISLEHTILFKEWFDEASKIKNIVEANSMVLSTCNKENKPSSRVILLKNYDDSGFTFYTNLTSRKGKEINENPYVCACFYWEETGKQIRIEGKVEKVSIKEADDYFVTRSRGSQLGAWASKQSHVMADQEELAHRLKDITQQFEGQVIPRPPFWSGYKIVPDNIEFWQKGEYRLHKRILYNNNNGNWEKSILYP